MPRRHTRRVKRAGTLNDRGDEPEPASAVPRPDQIVMARQRMDPNNRQNLREMRDRLARSSNVFSAAMTPEEAASLPSRSPVLTRTRADGDGTARRLDFDGMGRRYIKSKKQSHRRRGRHTRRR